jgi:hypothetical protein
MASTPVTYTKDSLIAKLKEITNRGFIPNARPGNAGGIGNTLEDLLGIEENNLPMPNAAEWELKTHRLDSTALTTLLHIEPSPRAVRFVPRVLLPQYGWAHQAAGTKYPRGEMSFRQTIHGKSRSDRGFKVVIDRAARKVLISFDAKSVDPRHADWLETVKRRAGLGELNPQPYWGFDDLEHVAGVKLPNAFFVQAEVKREGKKEFYRYCRVTMLQTFSFDGFLSALEDANLLIDFDARSGHNHGTKFRLREDCLPQLYAKATRII